MENAVITEYVAAAMRKGKYEQVPDEGVYFGKIPGFKGLWASANTRIAAEAELRERLEEWIVLSLRLNMELPVVSGLTLNRTLSPVRGDVVHA